MAENRRDVVVRFLAQTGQLEKGSDVVRGRLAGVATSLQGIATLGGVVAGVNFFKTAIDEGREAERVTRKTEQVIRTTGGAAKVTANQVGELSGSMSELAGVDDEVIQQGANVLLTFTKVRNEVGNGNDVFDQATEVSLDMAAALDKTGDSGAAMQENIVRVGKALNDPIKGMTALTKIGVTFTAQQRAQVEAFVESGDILSAQKVILRELQTEFGGMSKASADATDKVIVGWGNFAEDMGKKVLPAVNAVSNWALHTGIPALGRVAETVGDVVEPAFDGLVSTGRGLIDLWQDMPSPIQTGIVALAAWQLVGDRVTGTFGRMSGGARGLGDDVRTAMGAFEVGRVQGTLMALEERIPVVGQMSQAFRDTASTTMALGSAMGGVQGRTAQFGAALRGTAVAAVTGLRAAASGLVGFFGGPWGLAFAGAAVAIGMFTQRAAEAKQKQTELRAVGERVAEIMRNQAGATKDAVRASVAKEAADSGLLKTARELGISVSDVVSALMGEENALDRVNSVIDTNNQKHNDNAGFLQQGLDLIADNTGGINSLEERYAAFQGQLSDAAQGQKDYNEALSLANTATGEASEATSKYAVVGSMAVTSTDLMKSAVEGAGIELEQGADATDHMREAIEALHRQATISTDTWEGYEASVDALTASVAENGHTLDIHTEAGRANRDALEDVAAKSRDLMLADIESGAPADQALARHQARIAALHDEATAVFGANSEANTLIDTYGRVPKGIETAITTKGYEDVKAKMDDLSAGQFLLASGLEMTPANVRAVLQERKSRFADGGHVRRQGHVRGPGGARGDKVKAMLSDDEFVQQSSAVRYYGTDFMYALNNRQIPREALPMFAGGGLVVPMPVDLSKTKIPDPSAMSVAPGGASIKQLQQFALAQKGKLYQWGSTGPNTWDCSGLVGAIWALAHGKNPYQRYMTTASMGVGQYGMKAGKGAVTVYLGPGHTAANIGGLHAEAYGGNGVPLAIGHVGTPLGYYNQVMHLANGGLVSLKGDPAARAASFAQKGWPEPTSVGGYKNGGWLMPGQLAFNETRKPERIFTEEQFQAMAGGKVEKHYHLTTITQAHQVDVPMQFARMEWLEG